MASKRLSPTGTLLRNSRLFSLPPPLPHSSQNLIAARRFDSETATLPYPTQAAIETTPASLARGDWGLKRSLPLKSTARTSTPIIRIGDVDSINHITDFESAADHALNLKKWQEMGLPVSKADPPREKMSDVDRRGRALLPHRSVFESSEDNTGAESSSLQRGRWKYEGPWLAGQTQGEFEVYAERTIRERREDFREFLRKRHAQKETRDRRRRAIDEGEPASTEPATISDDQLEIHIKDLRTDEATLFSLIEEFLDLPSKPGEAGKWSATAEGPPTTHPSAGLSYLRTHAHTLNHPVYGPQRDEKPLQGRVLATQSPSRPSAIIGVGGIVAEDNRAKAPAGARTEGVNSFEPDIPGGARVSVKPERITIDSQGKIKLQITRADSKLVSLYDQPPEELPEEPIADTIVGGQRQIPEMVSRPQKPTSRGAQGYGLEGTSMRGRPPRATGFSESQALLQTLDK